MTDRPSDWTIALPAPVVGLFAAFRGADERLVMVGPAARALAVGDDVGALRRFDFVTDADRGSLHRLASAVPGLRAEEGRGRGSVTFHGPGDLVVHAAPGREPTAAEADAVRRLAAPREWLAAWAPFVRDLASREITIHAIGVADGGEVLDPFGGLADVRARRLRTVVPPDRLVGESSRWVLRFARHVGYYGFDVDEATLAAARRDVGGILDIPPDVWRAEVQRALLHRHPDRALQYLQSAGVLSIVLPEVEAMVGYEQSCRVHHKDLWEHTKLVVLRSRPDAAQRWTALLHDVGKVGTRSVDADGAVHFLRHEELSAVFFTGVAARLRFPRELADKVLYLVRSHSRVNLYSEEWTESAVRRLIREVGEHLDDLLAFSRADITSRREERVEYLRQLMDDLDARIAAVQEKDAHVPPLPKGIGNLIMRRFGLAPCETVGVLRKRLEGAIEDGTLPRGLEPEAYVERLAAWLEAERGGGG